MTLAILFLEDSALNSSSLLNIWQFKKTPNVIFRASQQTFSHSCFVRALVMLKYWEIFFQTFVALWIWNLSICMDIEILNATLIRLWTHCACCEKMRRSVQLLLHHIHIKNAGWSTNSITPTIFSNNSKTNLLKRYSTIPLEVLKTERRVYNLFLYRRIK